MHANIKIVGYYDHFNLGDEQYKIAFKNFFDFYFKGTLPNIEFIDCDKLNKYTFEPSDIIVIGGGDILNDYFLDKLISKFNNSLNKIIAISVGLPFTPILTDTTKLYIIDYIFIRTRVDLELFSTYFHTNRIFYIPDISYLTLQNISTQHPIINTLIDIRKSGKKIVTLSLSKHISKSLIYINIITSMTQFIKYLITFNFHVFLLPYNTNKINDSENDIIIHTQIYNNIKSENNPNIYPNITNITDTLDITTILNIYDYVDYNVPMRFHSFLLSTYKKVPSLPIYTTRKIENLIHDISYPVFYKLPVDSNFQPTECSINGIIDNFSQLLQNQNIKNVLINYNQCVFDDITKSLDIFYNLIHESYNKIHIQSLLNETDSKIKNLYDILQNYIKNTNVSDFRHIQNENSQNIIVGITSFYLTGSINSIYNHGLKEKMFNRYTLFDWYTEWKWILQTEKYSDKKQSLIDNPNGFFNIDYIDQNDNSGVHRSGWQYVYQSITKYHNKNAPLLLDMYLDRTFHWNKDINKLIGVIPYTTNWIGFIHHTFDTSFSEYNCNNMFQTNEFLDSLPYCKGIFVLSNHLKTQLQSHPKLEGIPIFNLVHPTDCTAPKFTIDNFVGNTDKNLLYIGGWLRNTFTFFNLQLPKNIKLRYGYFLGDTTSKFLDTISFNLKKVSLIGKNMSNYYPSENFIYNLHNILVKKPLNEPPHLHDDPNISRNHFNIPTIGEFHDVDKEPNVISNNWNKFFYNNVLDILKSVDYLTYLDNDVYDNLLSQNIVFIHLVDASAVNTVIECIVRNTPIIINNHPAIVELLGSNYPLYFKSTNYIDIINEVSILLSDTTNLKNATKYLSKIDNSIFNIDYFTQSFINHIQKLS